MNFSNLCIGILAIHGSVEEHEASLKKCGIETLLVKSIDDLEKIDGLIIPGGESTTIGKLLNWYGIATILKKKIKKGLPVYGTCAGAILLAKKIIGHQKTQSLKVMDIEIERNGYGRQVDSFEGEVVLVICGGMSVRQLKIPGIFIRAPKIKKIGKNIKILAICGKEMVLVREKNMLAGTFHPELTDDLTVHKYFLEMCGDRKVEK